MIKIRRTDNGFVTTHDDISVDGEEIEVETVFEEEDEEEKPCMTKLLYFVAEHFGSGYSKWEFDNLNITWDKKGHKIN